MMAFSNRIRKQYTFVIFLSIVTKFIWQINSFMMTWLPHLERNNRSYVTIAIGCTGGKHRSVYIAEMLAKNFRKEREDIQTHHRDIDVKST